MPRLSAAVFLGAGLLVTTWVSAPAAPTMAPVRVSDEDVALIESMAPLAAELDQEASQLRARLAAPVAPPSTKRDPFSFGARRPAPPPVAVLPPVVPVAPAPVAPPEVPWPTLAAIMGESDAGADKKTAVVAMADAIEFLVVGGVFKDFTVVSISVGSIELRHDPTGRVQVLTLR